MRVKICGITNESDLKAAVEAGADAVGFVIEAPNSPRNLSLKKGKALIKKCPPFVSSVVITLANDRLTEIDDMLRPDCLQVYSARKKDLEGVSSKVIHSLVVGVADEKEILRVSNLSDALLLDSGHGSGRVHDWSLSKKICSKVDKPVILAGGLTPDNVREAIDKVRPFGVDCSTGVEAFPGKKDRGLVKRFVKNARDI